MSRLTGAGAAALLLAGAMGCVTINVYFPEAAVRDLSEQIEEQVREKAEELEEPAATEPEGDAQARLEAPQESRPLRLAILQSAGVPGAEVTSPKIERLIASRAQRLGEINRWKSQGVLGESNEALLVVRSLDSVSGLADRAAVQRLVSEENADRRKIFEEIAAIKQVDRSQLPRIQATYAETLRAQARPGDWIQMPDGQWARKGS